MNSDPLYITKELYRIYYIAFDIDVAGISIIWNRKNENRIYIWFQFVHWRKVIKLSYNLIERIKF